MTRPVKLAALRALKGLGVFQAMGGSQWRRRRLLVLCYHGISLRDEHEWNGGLYIPPEQFERRLLQLRESGCPVLSLSEGLERARRGDLPDRSVVVTFDDGMYDFYALAWPLLKKYEIPATVYLTTYHCDFNRPIFRVTCSYLLWKHRAGFLESGGLGGLPDRVSLAGRADRTRLVMQLDRYAKSQQMDARQKDGLIQQLAGRLGYNYDDILSRRLLHVMNPGEVAELTRAGIDFQLHTHRHRTPSDEALFCKEISDNAARLKELTGTTARHFCYPSGFHLDEFLPWLRKMGVESATTCDAGFVQPDNNWLLLPRMLDHTGVSDIEFESWLSGVSEMLPRRKLVPVDPDRIGPEEGA